MNCDEIKALLYEYCDGELTGADAENVRAHLAGCAGCRALAAELTGVNSLLKTASPLRAPDAAVSNVLSEVRTISARRKRAAAGVHWLGFALAAAVLLIVAGLDAAGISPIPAEFGRLSSAARETIFSNIGSIMDRAHAHSDFFTEAVFYAKAAGAMLMACLLLVAAVEEHFARRLAHKFHITR